MKKAIIMLFFVLCSLVSYAPNVKMVYIPHIEPIKVSYYEPLIRAIFKVEADYNPLAFNPKEGAYGGLQIRDCRIKHYNRLTNKNYTLEDMYDFEKAKEVFLYFAEGKSYEQAAKNWNGSGPMTITYWEKVKKALQI